MFSAPFEQSFGGKRVADITSTNASSLIYFEGEQQELVMNKSFTLKALLIGTVFLWRRVMDVKYNPLRHVADPSLQAYFMIVLFTMWSVAFGFIATCHLGWLGYDMVTSIAVHLSSLIPILVTNAVFIDAERDGEQWLVDWGEETSRKPLPMNSLKSKNLVRWNPESEA